MTSEHPYICDEDRDEATLGLEDTAAQFGLADDRIYRDHERCLEETDPDVVILCPVPSEHADWVERVAPYDVHVILEKPFATSVADADRMIATMEATGNEFVINWPLAWYPTHRTTKRLIDEGTIGDVIEVHYYDGNEGSGRFQQVEYSEAGEMHFVGEDAAASDPTTWWHQEDRGGGSLNDYLGYGVTLGTWFRDGDLPHSVTTDTHTPEWSAVDTHSVSIAHYDTDLSEYETRWARSPIPGSTSHSPSVGS